MLNELNLLSNALEKANITPKEWHPQLKLLPKASNKKPCYSISIDKDSSVSKIDELNLEIIPKLRKWEPSNGNSFPGFNIQPLYRITDAEQKKIVKSWKDGTKPVNIKILKSWCSDENNNWDNKHKVKISKCLIEIPNTLNNIICSTEHKDSEVITLIDRLIKVKNADTFQNNLKGYLWDCIKSGESIPTVLSILIYEGDLKKKKEYDAGNISIFLDISDWKEYPVASEKNINWLNNCLTSISKNTLTSNSVDAFGKSLTGGDDKLPSVKLPIIADIKLRAMNSESPCQSRYGTIDAFSFPIGDESRKQTKGALEWLGDESREGETWGRADAKELIFAYPSTLPKIPVKLAACFGAKKIDDTETRFANTAQDAIKGLQGISKDLRNLNLSVFSLKKMDKARTKVIFHRNYTAQRLADAAKEWQTGCSNIPEIKLRAWGSEKGKWEIFEPLVPYPLQVAQCLNRVWKRDGSTECETPVIPRTRGIELLLEEHSEKFVPHLLAVLLQNSRGMILFLGNAINNGEIISLKGYDAHKLLIPSIIGFLLFKLGYKKEDYMNDAPFLIGRMLKLADELHALYCKEVRDNNLPPQLIGNTLMTAALDSPLQALAQLALRLKPYYGWAKTFQKGDSAKLAGYFIGQYAETASQLANFYLPARFNDAERAQVLLGYLASNPKKSEKENNTSN